MALLGFFRRVLAVSAEDSSVLDICVMFLCVFVPVQTVFVLTRIAASPPLVSYKNLHDCGFAVAAVRLDEPMYARRSMHEDGSHRGCLISVLIMSIISHFSY